MPSNAVMICGSSLLCLEAVGELVPDTDDRLDAGSAGAFISVFAIHLTCSSLRSADIILR